MPSTVTMGGLLRNHLRAHLKPVLRPCCKFPFLVRGFHSDNGSEFLNYRVARLLDSFACVQESGHEPMPKAASTRPISIRRTITARVDVGEASNGKRRRRPAGGLPHAVEKLPLDKSCLKPGITVAFLEQQAGRMRHRVCVAHAAAQTRTARPLSHATLSDGLAARGRSRTGRSGKGREGEGEACVVCEPRPSVCSASPSP